MLISFADAIKKHGLTVTHVLHAGAHIGEEAETYHQLGVEQVLWIEANPVLIPSLRANVSQYAHDVVCACLGSESGVSVPFHVTNNAMSSSVLDLGTHKEKHPEVEYVAQLTLETRRIDGLAAEHGLMWDTLVMDLQGYELECLKGATRILDDVETIYSEINIDELYLGCALLSELDPWLVKNGFECVELKMCGCQTRNCSDRGNRWVGWGDAIWKAVDSPRQISETMTDDWEDWYG